MAVDTQSGESIEKYRPGAFEKVEVCDVTDNRYDWTVEEALSTSEAELRDKYLWLEDKVRKKLDASAAASRENALIKRDANQMTRSDALKMAGIEK